MTGPLNPESFTINVTQETIYEVYTENEKCNFPSRISSVNVTKSTVSSGFGHIYWEILHGRLLFLCSGSNSCNSYNSSRDMDQ